ncbi:hypothetical protein [Mycoplasmoides alvi]|uniref:hypothetical protein n=1 Tax=Mycoplasmoides alvi TaxID=78580 RepID=UPI00051B085F|nr:hypothetical protein [Mycoplasmoides alvi]
MIFFLIIGLFLSPFLLNTIKVLSLKKKLWMEPLFFILFVLFFLQISLSWFSLLQIPSYFLYVILAYFCFFVIIGFLLFSIIKLIFNKQINWRNLNWKIIFKHNYSSIICFCLLLISLIFLVSFPDIITFSDTNAYISISNYFKNGHYTMNNNDPLSYIYLLPSGFYLNSAFSSREYLPVAYNILWSLLIFYIFYWSVKYFVDTSSFHWIEKYKLMFTALFSSLYVSISFIIIFLLPSGNYEIQALFIFIAFIFVLTKSIHYVPVLLIVSQFFSITGALINIPIFLISFIYLFFAGKRLYIMYATWIGIYFGFILLSIFFQNNSYLQTLFILLGLFLLLSFSLVTFLLSRNYKFIWLYNYSFNWRFNFNKLIKSINLKLLFIFVIYILAFIEMFIVTYFITLNTVKDLLILLYLGGGIIFLIYGSYYIYLWIKHQKEFKAIRWIIVFQLGYIIYVLATQGLFNLFNANASSWRIILSTITLGYVSTYVGLIVILLLNIINNDYIYFTKQMWIHKKKYIKKLYLINIGLSSSLVGCASILTIVSWTIRWNWINQINDNIVSNRQNFQLNLEDYEQLNMINNLVRAPNNIATNYFENKPSIIPYSYYSDINLSLELNNCYAFTYGPTWETGLYNNFVLGDAWLKVFQNRSISTLMYVDNQNTTINFNYILQMAISNINRDLTIDYPNIQVAPKLIPKNQNYTLINSNDDVPITTDQISVHGAPDFLILNKNTDYYSSLEIIKSFYLYTKLNPDINSNNFIFSLTNTYGYQFMKETKNAIYFYNNKTFITK